MFVMLLMGLHAAHAAEVPTADASASEVRVVSDDGAHGFGIGAVIGEPTGLTLAARPNDYNAVQGHVSWSIIHDRFRASADYLQSLAVIETSGSVDVPLYVGLGLTLGAEGQPPWGSQTPWFGARVPLGITVLPEEVPLEVFGEVAPVGYLLPETTVGIEGALGARLYF